MEWLALTAIAAGVAISVALLWGFSGCDRVLGLHRDAYPPKNLTATAISSTEIQISWTPETSGEWFEIYRTPDGGDPVPLDKVHSSPITDNGLVPGATYSYKARTIGNDETSVWTDDVHATTMPVVLDFQPSFEATLPLGDNANPGRCIVQRIEAVRLLRSGSYLKLTISGSTNADLSIDRIFVSRVAAGLKPYDAAADLTHVASDVLIPAANPPAQVSLPHVPYALDADQPLLIAFDINSANQGFLRNAEAIVGTDAAAFSGNRQQAEEPIRTPGYSMLYAIYLVLKIEVA